MDSERTITGTIFNRNSIARSYSVCNCCYHYRHYDASASTNPQTPLVVCEQLGTGSRQRPILETLYLRHQYIPSPSAATASAFSPYPSPALSSCSQSRNSLSSSKLSPVESGTDIHKLSWFLTSLSKKAKTIAWLQATTGASESRTHILPQLYL